MLREYFPVKRRSSFIYGVCILLTEGIFAIQTYTNPILASALWIGITSVILTAAILIAEIIKPPQTKTDESIFFVAQTICASLSILAAHRHYFDWEIPLTFPYTGLKILALCLALSTPKSSLSVWISFAILALGPMAQNFYWTLEGHGHYSFSETWINLVFTLFAIAIWVSRLRLQQAYHRMLWLESRAKSANGLAHLLLGARHLQNSALQSIESHTALIEFKCPAARPHTQEIQKAINHVVRLSAALEVYDGQAEWSHEDLPRDHKEFELRLSDFNQGKYQQIPEV